MPLNLPTEPQPLPQPFLHCYVTPRCGIGLTVYHISSKRFFKWANPGLFLIYFHLFKLTLQFLQQINVKKCRSSIQFLDSNLQPLEHESPPITTRPGLPP